MRRRIPSVVVPFVVVPVAVYLIGLFFIALFVVKPPLIGWVGFAIAGAAGVAIATLAASFFRRVSVNADPARKADDHVHRVLVLVDEAPADGLPDELRSHLRRRPAEVRVVSPVLASPVHFGTNDEEREAGDARARLDKTVAALARMGVPASGGIGTDDPLQAIGDALVSFPADEIVVMTSQAGEEQWLEHGLRNGARQLYRIPVTCIRQMGPPGLEPGTNRL